MFKIRPNSPPFHENCILRDGKEKKSYFAKNSTFNNKFFAPNKHGVCIIWAQTACHKANFSRTEKFLSVETSQFDIWMRFLEAKEF